MAVFADYAKFYDIIYRDKNYSAECDFLEKVFAAYSKFPVQRILDLGCGTGGHAFIFAKRKYSISGVDFSEKMLSIAEKKARLLKIDNKPAFQQADIRTLNLRKTFDAVICMFAVMTYMNTNEDILSTFKVARRHLNRGGLFVFDTWSGWAVLRNLPVERTKIFNNNGKKIIRRVHPELDMPHHLVRMHYQIQEKQGKRLLNEVEETHDLRFLFPQEIGHYLTEAGFNLKKICPFLRQDSDLSANDWYLTAVAEAK